jgi:hypothetical protein
MNIDPTIHKEAPVAVDESGAPTWRTQYGPRPKGRAAIAQRVKFLTYRNHLMVSVSIAVLLLALQ